MYIVRVYRRNDLIKFIESIFFATTTRLMICAGSLTKDIGSDFFFFKSGYIQAYISVNLRSQSRLFVVLIKAFKTKLQKKLSATAIHTRMHRIPSDLRS